MYAQACIFGLAVNTILATPIAQHGTPREAPVVIPTVPDNVTNEQADVSGSIPPGSSKYYNQVLPLPNYDYPPNPMTATPLSPEQDGSLKRVCQNDARLAPSGASLQAPMDYFQKLPDDGTTKEVNLHPGKCLTKYPQKPEQEKDNVRVSICSPSDSLQNLSIQNVAVWAAVKDLADHCQGKSIGGVSKLLSGSARTNDMYVLVDKFDTPKN